MAIKYVYIGPEVGFVPSERGSINDTNVSTLAGAVVTEF
jgi:hypothetical protein